MLSWWHGGEGLGVQPNDGKDTFDEVKLRCLVCFCVVVGC